MFHLSPSVHGATKKALASTLFATAIALAGCAQTDAPSLEEFKTFQAFLDVTEVVFSPPPNVGGWPEGKAWLASGAIVARANFLAALVEGRLTQSGVARDFSPLVERHCGDVNLARGIEWLAELAFGGLPKTITRGVEREATGRGKDSASALSAAVLILYCRPEAHLA